jgi:hypothetical protein
MNQTMQNIEELKQQILDLIECMYSHLFINRMELEVSTLSNDLKAYILKLYIHD